MKRLLIIFCTAYCLIFISFVSSANAVLPSVQENIEKQITQKEDDEKGLSEREIIEEGTFPFLPENHRDSGTGKFMAFK